MNAVDEDGLVIKVIDPASYKKRPWPNGEGVNFDISGGPGCDWRFSRTPITQDSSFSDYSGHDRRQVLIEGKGLVLKTPRGEIDVRRPFEPVQFAGETGITSVLENGAVTVINLIGKRSEVRIDLCVLCDGQSTQLLPGHHFVYCGPTETAVTLCNDEPRPLNGDHTMHIQSTRVAVLAVEDGRVVVGCVLRV